MRITFENYFEEDSVKESTVILSDDIKCIGKRAFSTIRIHSVELPNGLERIEEEAFWGCVTLESIDIPDSVKYIGPRAFADCSMLHQVSVFSDTVISERAFEGCTKLADSNGFIIVNDELYDYMGNENAVVPEGVKRIRGYAFSKVASRAVSITLPETLVKIDSCAFKNTKAKIIYITAKTTDICDDAFDNENTVICAPLFSVAHEYAMRKPGITFIPMENKDIEIPKFDEIEAARNERIEKYKIKSTQLDSKHSAYHTMAKMPKEFNTSFYEEHSYLLADDTSPVVMLSDWMESGEGQLLLVAAPPKRGKTHLLTMIYESLRNCFPNKKIIFGDAEPVLSEVREMIAEDVCNPIGKLADNDILLLDNCSNIGETVEADRKILKKCADKITGEKGGICVFAFSTEGLNELDDIESLVNGIMCDDKTSFIYMLDDDKVMKHCCAVEYAEKNGYMIDETELDLIATRAGSISEVKEMISAYCSEQAELIPGQNEQAPFKTRAKDALSAFYDNTVTRLKLRAKRIKRSVQNWIDPEFDWNKYAERECLTEDGCDYYIADKKIFNDTEYTLFINVDDAEDMVFRKSIMIDGEEYYAGLDDDAEFDAVCEKFFPASRKAEDGKRVEQLRQNENRLYIKNTYSKVLYVIANLYWLLMAILMYNPLLCSPLPGLSEEASYIVFWSMIALMMVVGVVAAFPRRRNSGSILANVMLPIGLYTLIAYYNMHSVFAQFTISAAAVLAIEFTSAVIKVKTSKITGKEVSIGNRLRHAFHGSRVIVAFCLTVFAVVMWICAFAGLYSS